MSSGYEVIFENLKDIEKTLKRFPNKVKRQVQEAFDSLEDEPLPPNCLSCKKLRGHKKYYTFEVGNYRIIYEPHIDTKKVRIIIVGDRKSVYKKFERKKNK